MEIELSITVDEEETNIIKDVMSVVSDGESAINVLSTRERYVLRALWQNQSGAARRVIHRSACEIDGSPFNSPEVNGTERDEVGEILTKLEDIGLARREKSTWYPSEDARIAEMELETTET